MRFITQSELQDDLQRFQGRFTSRVADASAPLIADQDPSIRRSALDLRIRFTSGSLDIVLGPDTDANLLDMVTFVELARALVDEYWIPEVFSGRSTELRQMAQEASEDVWRMARKVLSQPEEVQLRRIIQAWRAQNPGCRSISGLRLSEFASPGAAGFGFASVREEATGLFSGVKQAVQSADQARQLAERAMFAVQRLPFLIRMHGRMAGQELMTDTQQYLMVQLRQTARFLLKGTLLLGGLVGLGLLLHRPLRRRWARFG